MRKLLLVCLLLCCATAQAQLEIDVTQGIKDATPIAIVPFASQGAKAPTNVAAIVSADLHRSGMFKPLKPSDLLSRPSREKDIIYRDFRVLGVSYLVVGQVKRVQGEFHIHYGLYDSNRQTQLVSQTYKAKASQLRDVAHAIADKIFEKLTGVPGVFGTKILYVTFNRGAKYAYQLQYADADGARVQTVLRSKEPIMSPTWSPDGKRIAYVSFERDGGLPAIYVHTLATGKRHIVSDFPGINGAPAFSPNGKRLAFTLSKDGNTEIYVKDLQTGKLVRETHSYSIDTSPCWMPDGKTLLFTSGRSGGPQIYKMNLATKKVSRVTFSGSYNAKPSITPDGRFLVYVHRQNGKYHIAVQDLKRGSFHIVTQTRLDESPSVAPNGSMVIYGTLYRGKNVLEAVSIDGRVKIRLPSKEGDVSDPAWSPYL